MSKLFEDLEKQMDQTKDKTEYMKARAVYLLKAEGKKAKEVASIVNTTEGMVYKWSHLYKKF